MTENLRLLDFSATEFVFLPARWLFGWVNNKAPLFLCTSRLSDPAVERVRRVYWRSLEIEEKKAACTGATNRIFQPDSINTDDTAKKACWRRFSPHCQRPRWLPNPIFRHRSLGSCQKHCRVPQMCLQLTLNCPVTVHVLFSLPKNSFVQGKIRQMNITSGQGLALVFIAFGLLASHSAHRSPRLKVSPPPWTLSCSREAHFLENNFPPRFVIHCQCLEWNLSLSKISHGLRVQYKKSYN